MRNIGVDKKGQGLQLSTIILIVLGIAVLVFLIFGFSVGWGNLWDRIQNFSGGKVNLDTIKQGCALACAEVSSDKWCTQVRSVNFAEKVKIKEKESTKHSGTCDEFTGAEFVNAGLVIDTCPEISC